MPLDMEQLHMSFATQLKEYRVRNEVLRSV